MFLGGTWPNNRTNKEIGPSPELQRAYVNIYINCSKRLAMIFARGLNRVVEITEEGYESLREAEARVRPACAAQLRALIQQFANAGSLRAPDKMRNEGDGVYAIKANCGLRAYGWFHRHRQGVFVISHVIVKQKNKMDNGDRDRVLRNRDIYER